MTLTQLRYFCEIARTGHFTAAANNMYVSQSSLSYSIKELEKELGVSLFERSANKKISLTPFGQVLLSYAETSLKLIDEGENEIATMRDSLFGNIKFAMFFSIANTFAPVLLDRFRAECKANYALEMSFDVSHSWTNLKEQLLSGRADMLMSANKLSDSCKSELIGYHRVVLLTPNDHPLAQKESVTLDDFADEKILTIDINSNLDKCIKKMYCEADRKPDFKYVSNWGAQHLSIASGEGLGLSIDVPVCDRVLKAITIDDPLAIMPIYLSWSTEHPLSQAATYVRDSLIALAKEMMENGEVF